MITPRKVFEWVAVGSFAAMMLTTVVVTFLLAVGVIE